MSEIEKTKVYSSKSLTPEELESGVVASWGPINNRPLGIKFSKLESLDKRSLTKFIDKEVKFSKFQQYRQLSKILEELPKDVILAGGFVLSLIHNCAANDIDFFFRTPKSFRTTYELLTNKYKFEFKDLKNKKISDVFMDREVHEIKLYPTKETYNSGISLDLVLPIQLIKTSWFSEPLFLLESFDFTVNQLAIFDGNFWFNKRSLNDIKNNKLVPSYLAKGSKAIYRIAKYYKKGFEMEPKLLEQIFKVSVADGSLSQDVLDDIKSLMSSLETENIGYGTTVRNNPQSATPSSRPRPARRTAAQVAEELRNSRINVQPVPATSTPGGDFVTTVSCPSHIPQQPITTQTTSGGNFFSPYTLQFTYTPDQIRLPVPVTVQSSPNSVPTPSSLNNPLTTDELNRISEDIESDILRRLSEQISREGSLSTASEDASGNIDSSPSDNITF